MKSPPPPLLLLLLISAVLRPSSASTSPYPPSARPTKSGYLTVNSTSGSAIFYTYYESQTRPTTTHTPILVWLQGGPGCSSMLANFVEIGPYLLNQNLTLYPNPHSWNNLFGLLFLDNPIGTGFSFAASSHEIPRNQNDVAKHLLIALHKFLSLDKSFESRPIYLTGESYAGKYLPSLGYHILQKTAGKRINLAGIAIGNGLTDPESQVATHATNFYELGLINRKQTSIVEKLQSEAVEFVRSRKWNSASNKRTEILNRLTNMTGLATLYDFRRLRPYPNGVVALFLNKPEVKKALGVKESTTFQLCSPTVADALHDDGMKSVIDQVEFLVIKGMKLLLYQGQCDLRDGVASTLAWVQKMKGVQIQGFLAAERKVWRVNGGLDLAGYVQRYKNFSHVVVMNAGHLVPADQPMNSRIMTEDWVLNKGLFA